MWITLSSAHETPYKPVICQRVEDVRANTGFEMLFAEDLTITPEPSDEELRVLRQEVDPLALITGKH